MNISFNNGIGIGIGIDMIDLLMNQIITEYVPVLRALMVRIIGIM